MTRCAVEYEKLIDDLTCNNCSVSVSEKPDEQRASIRLNRFPDPDETITVTHGPAEKDPIVIVTAGGLENKYLPSKQPLILYIHRQPHEKRSVGHVLTIFHDPVTHISDRNSG